MGRRVAKDLERERIGSSDVLEPRVAAEGALEVGGIPVHPDGDGGRKEVPAELTCEIEGRGPAGHLAGVPVGQGDHDVPGFAAHLAPS
jgi:hypothetical protein